MKIRKYQSGGIKLLSSDRSAGFGEWLKEWWNDYPKDYSDRKLAVDRQGNVVTDCARYSNNILKSKGYKSYGDAWVRIPYSNAKVLYTGYDNNLPKTFDSDTYAEYLNGAAERLAQAIDFSKLKDYDIVGLTVKDSPSSEKAFNKGRKHGRINTHTGHIRVGDDGTRYVIHNVASNLYQHKLEDLLGKDKIFSVVEIARPSK